MDRIRPNAEAAPKPRGLLGDVHQLQTSSTATAEELRDFVRHFRGKNPQEMLGLVAQSGLIRAVIQATAMTVILIAAFTVGPYLWNKSNSPTATAKIGPPAAAANSKSENDKPKATPASQPAPVDTAENTKSGESKQPVADKGKVLEKLGMDEAKKADPNANPLENKADDLLKDLK